MRYHLKFAAGLSLITGFLLVPAMNSAARVIYLPDEYKTIQQAIDVSQPGDEIKLAAGIYEGSVSLKHGVSLYGEDPNTTIITDSPYVAGPIVTLAGKCTLKGVTIKGAKASSQGAIYVKAGSPYITNCKITENRNSGIFVDRGTSPTIEYNQVFKNNRSAIEIVKANPRILTNELYQNRGFGILVSGVIAQTENNPINSNNQENAYKTQAIIKGNTIKNNKGGAIMCQDSSPVIIENKIADRRGRSILLVMSNAIIKKNKITSGGPPAIYIDSGNPVIEENTIDGVLRFAILGESKLGSIKNNKVKTLRGSLLGMQGKS